MLKFIVKELEKPTEITIGIDTTGSKTAIPTSNKELFMFLNDSIEGYIDYIQSHNTTENINLKDIFKINFVIKDKMYTAIKAEETDFFIKDKFYIVNSSPLGQLPVYIDLEDENFDLSSRFLSEGQDKFFRRFETVFKTTLEKK